MRALIFTISLVACMASDHVSAKQTHGVLTQDDPTTWARRLELAAGARRLDDAVPAPPAPPLGACVPAPLFNLWLIWNPLAWIGWAWSIGSPCVEIPEEEVEEEQEWSTRAIVLPEEQTAAATNSILPEWMPRSGLGDDYDKAFAAGGAFSLLVVAAAALVGGSRARIGPLSRGGASLIAPGTERSDSTDGSSVAVGEVVSGLRPKPIFGPPPTWWVKTRIWDNPSV